MAMHKVICVGTGEIFKEQHRKVLEQFGPELGLQLAATVSPSARDFGVPHYRELSACLTEHVDADVVVIASPTAAHYYAAIFSLDESRHVFCEKPTTETLTQLLEIEQTARVRGVVFFPGLHAVENEAVDILIRYLKFERIRQVRIIWKESFTRWHGTQEWCWRSSGMGVNDPGFNALSIAAQLGILKLHSAKHWIPRDAEEPAIVELVGKVGDADFHAHFDWTLGEAEEDQWDIEVTTRNNTYLLKGVRSLYRNGKELVAKHEDHEYERLYRRFARVLRGEELPPPAQNIVSFVEQSYLVAKREHLDTPHP